MGLNPACGTAAVRNRIVILVGVAVLALAGPVAPGIAGISNQAPTTSASNPPAKGNPTSPLEPPSAPGLLSSFVDASLLLGIASVAAILVLGGIRLHSHMLRVRRQLGWAAAVAGPAFEPRAGALSATLEVAAAEEREQPEPAVVEPEHQADAEEPPLEPEQQAETEEPPLEQEPEPEPKPEPEPEPIVAAPETDDFALTGRRVETIIEEANEFAARTLREAEREAADIRARAEAHSAARTERLTAQIMEIRSEGHAHAQSLRDEAEGYAFRRSREADLQAKELLAEAEAYALERKSSAETISRETADELGRWTEAARVLDDRLRTAFAELQQLATDVEGFLGERRDRQEDRAGAGLH